MSLEPKMCLSSHGNLCEKKMREASDVKIWKSAPETNYHKKWSKMISHSYASRGCRAGLN